jgi:glycosyltransferase involved in cell wall biosynthesis
VTEPHGVSVVIPTRGRPDLVVRAVESALAQIPAPLEVIVVIDGTDETSARALRDVRAPHLRIETLPERRGIGAARNAGVRAARGRWIAFLDDDDEWQPGKLAAQLRVADRSALAHPIVAGRILVRVDSRELVWPRRLPAAGEPLSEYLFARRTPFWGEAVVQTSTWLVERALLDAVPFDERLAKHEDLDWLLHASEVSGTAVEFVPDPTPLAVWNADDGRPRASTRPDWRGSRAWIRSVRGRVTRRAYAAFLLTWVAGDAAREGDGTALWELPWEACRHGRPRAIDFLVFLAIWTVPRRLRRGAAKAVATRTS